MYVWSRLVPLAALLALAAGCAAARPTHTQVITPRDAAIARYRRANEGAIPSVLSQLGDKDMRVALRSGASNGGDPFLLSEREAGLEDTRADLGRIEIPLGSPYASDPEMADLLLEQQVLGELVAEETARLASERDLAEHAVDLLVASQLYVDKSPMVEDPDALLAWRIAIVKDALKPNTISRYERAELAGWLRDIAPGAWSGSDRTQKRGPKTTTAAAAMEKHLASIPVAPYPTRTEEEVDRGVKAFLGIPGSFDAVEPYAERASGVLRAQLEIAFGVLSPSAADDVRRRAIALLAHPPPCAPHYPVPGVADQLPRDEVLARLKPWLESVDRKKVLQNAKYDQHVFANHGIALAGIAHDTMLQSYVIESDKGHDLGQLCTRHLGLETIAYEDLCGKGAKQIGFDQVDIERAATYAAEDADVTLRVHDVLHPRFADEPGLSRIYHEIEMPARQVIWQMERNGILIDGNVLARQSHEIGQKIMALEAQAYELAGQPFNLASPKQLGDILFTKLGLPVKKKTASGGPSTDEEVLSELALDYPLPKLLLEHRSLSKLKGTYTDKLPRQINPETGRVHTHFSQASVVTGRLASSDPNLQNIPVRTEEGRRIRTAFIAPAGSSIVSADYSQIELRIMAHLSGDERLLDAFAHGEDVHRASAAEIFGVTPLEVGPDQRRVAKSINFGLIYGMSAFGLARQLGLERSAAQTYIDRYFTRYPGVARYMEEARQTARDKGYVETAFGRRLWFPEIRSSQAMRRQGAERAAINAPMQGTAADLIKLAMIAVQDWLSRSTRKSRLILQVHDELLLEVPDDELSEVRAHLPRLMGQVAELKVPLVVEVGIGPNWEAAH